MLRFSSSNRLGSLTVLGLVLVLLGTALLFPGGGPAGAALVLLVALAGAGIARVGARRNLELPGWAGDVLVVSGVLACSVGLFAETWNTSGLRIYDWGPHHANLRHLVDGLRRGHIPRWVHGVSTGDSPYELYAFLPYYLTARLALLTDATDLTLALVRSAILTHSLAAIGAGVLARRLVGWPLALLVGLATLYDVGSVWGGGVSGILHLGVTHSALANAVWPFALVAIIRALVRPRLGWSIAIWALVALAVACHPLGLVTAVAVMFALLAVALLARDVPAYRACVTAFHVLVGVMLVAFVWMPFGQRLILYGVHFAEAGRLSWEHFGHILRHPIPEATFGPLVYAGYLGILVAILSRRAVPTLLAAMAGVLFAGLFDQLYVLLDLVPSVETARFQTVRLASAAKIAIYVCGAWLGATAVAAARAATSPRGAWAVGAVVAVMVAAVLRVGLPYYDRLTTELRTLATVEVPDAGALAELATWAKQQNAALRPDRYARLLDERSGNSYLVYHVHALSELPSLWAGAVSALFLRERIEDVSPASLRRFNVRWVMRADGTSPSVGDPATEKRFRGYVLRELPEWDGAFARIERGEGTVRVLRLEDERIDVEVSGTSRPALVALGMGYYPRWRANHEQQGALPVYAIPSIEGGRLQIPAAWLPPGRTTFTPSGSLPSDGAGRIPTGLAILVAFAVIVLWSVPARPLVNARTRLLRATARALRWSARHRRRLALGGAGLAAMVLAVAAILSAGAPARALQVGNGLRAPATVEALIDGSWKTCGYRPMYGAYRCPGPVLVQDTTAQLLNDAPPSPPFVVPAIHVTTVKGQVAVRIRMRARLHGEYWAATNGPRVDLELSGEAPIALFAPQISVVFDAPVVRTLTLTTTVAPNQPLDVAFVQRRRLDVRRPYPSPPDEPK